jgi:hypothetical protein
MKNLLPFKSLSKAKIIRAISVYWAGQKTSTSNGHGKVLDKWK